MSVAYVSNADSREISVLRLDDEGALTLVESQAVDGTVMPLAMSPDHRYLYASLRSAPFAVAVFARHPATGRLTPLPSAPLPDNMAYLATDRSGRYLLSASYSGDKIAVNPIASDGGIGPPIAVESTPPHAHSILTDPSNRYLFAAALGGDAILQYRFDAETGRLTPNEPPQVETAPGAGPRHPVFHPSGAFAFVTNELDGTVNSYRFESCTGTLTLIASAAVRPPESGGPPWTSELRGTPDGRYLYVAERTSSTITGFRIDPATGLLDPVGHTPTEAQPRGFAIDPSGRFLVVAGQKSDAVTSYAIDPATGSLTPRQRLAVGRDPNWVEIVALQ
ncbi:lactonase family protein [Nocardia pseudovaccinii]|uniref:lactonase family protein n=1 Tax=Nocardia pseudovaccinii TaxID=189540 RepID=UPI0007A4FD0C|nr:beta-propeller fold lactonase family protein [Nocardia pseudovaccinii]